MPIGFFKSIIQKFAGRPVDWDELEEMLIRGDLGVKMSMRILDELQKRGGGVNAQTVVAVARQEILLALPRENPPIRPFPAKPKVILVVGVNGTGKTTSVAKLAHYFKSHRHSVLLAAADTFRAAAIEQLGVWSERIGIEMVRGEYQADPASLCYDAYQRALSRNIEFLICDTAGRLHTKSNLMQEINKVNRMLGKQDESAPHESLLVVDATTGSNALNQAREFHAAVGLTGIVMTKLDGSGKGGGIVAIHHELGIPPRFVGTGENLGDLAFFDPHAFVEGLL